MSGRRIGLAYNPTNEAAVDLLDRAVRRCRTLGADHWSAQAGDTPSLVGELPTTDVLMVLGGDGTFLLAAQAVAQVDVPILGVNLGKIGFLSKVEAHELEPVLDQLVAGRYETRERMMLEATTLPGGGVEGAQHFVALNDVVVARGSLARVCRLQVSVGPSHVGTFIADGLVVASPTGSTGYSFSAGGPIVEPASRALIVTPIAAYLSTLRSIVVGPDEVIRTVVVAAHEALVSIDGREDRPLREGDVVEVRAMQRPIRFVEPRGAIPFWDLLRRKVELLPS
jgi:NAD+ kinase